MLRACTSAPIRVPPPAELFEDDAFGTPTAVPEPSEIVEAARKQLTLAMQNSSTNGNRSSTAKLEKLRQLNLHRKRSSP